MRTTTTNYFLPLVAAALLFLASTAQATPGHGHAYGHSATYNFSGVYVGDGVVNVTKGNHSAREAGFVGRDVTFNFSSARVNVRDTNDDGVRDLADVQAGDRVKVQAKLSRDLPATEPIAARQLNVKGSGSDDSGHETEDNSGD